jgi:molybdenum cofactor biosynthesis enzyme MoaA
MAANRAQVVGCGRQCDGAPGRVLDRGQQAAEHLIERQRRGIRAASEAGLTLKVNTVLVPGVNDQHVARLAQQLGQMGVRLMNLMPLIPAGAMRALRPPHMRRAAPAESEDAAEKGSRRFVMKTI